MSIFFYAQSFSNVVREGLEQRDTHQSILELGYHFSCSVWRERAFCFDCFKWFTGGFLSFKIVYSHSRKKEGLAYTISSHFDIFFLILCGSMQGLIEKNRTRTMTLMSRQVSDLKRGKFTSEELRLTKEMIINAAKLTQDRPGTLIERAYLHSILGKQFLSIDDWIQAIQLVTKEEIMAVAKSLKLQAVYFMEGREMIKKDLEKIDYPAVGECVYQTSLQNGLKLYLIPKADFNESYAIISTKFGSVDTRFTVEGVEGIKRISSRDCTFS